MQFLKECRKIIFSLTFVLYVLGVCMMYFTQFHSDSHNPIIPPIKGAANYGTIVKEVPEVLMPAAIKGLINEYCTGSYTAYPIGFYKNVRLSKEKTNYMADIIYELSGIRKDHLESIKKEQLESIRNKNNLNEINISSRTSYEYFRELMRKADKLIGGGSNYSDKNIVNSFSRIPKTYEVALLEYNVFLKNDKITNAYARLYCDYMCIPIAVLPVFISVAICLKDKKSNMQSLIFSRKVSSLKLITVRYFAMILMMTIPIIITAIAGTYHINDIYPNNKIDMTAIFKYSFMWLIPNIMISTSIGMFITELTSRPLAILINGMWWFLSLFTSAGSLTGSIGKFTLIVRHNSLFDSDIFTTNFNTFLFNRIFFTIISMIIIVLTVVVYEMKRSGRINVFSKLDKNYKSKFAS